MPSKKPKQPKVKTPVAPPPPKPRNVEGDGDFPALVAQVQQRFDAIPTNKPLFLVSNDGLFDTFIAGLPPHLRAHYTCNCCRSFFNHFGGLVVVDDEGSLSSPLWDIDAAEPFRVAVDELRRAVTTRTIVSAFVTADPIAGTPSSNGWDHFAVKLPSSRRHQSFTESPQAAAAKLREETTMLRRGLAEFPMAVVEKALALATSGTLQRPEKAEPMLRWLLDLHVKLRGLGTTQRDALLWQIAATAPAGFTHVRGGIVGTLLEDVAAGLSTGDIARRWAEKVDPSQYMRAQVAPSAGNLRRAESIIQAMEAAGSLRRRYVTVGDAVETLWSWKEATPTAASSSGPVFGHIAAKAKAAPTTQPLDLAEVKMTWDKFRRTMLADAENIEYNVSSTMAQFAALVTAVDASAPPILQWDGNADGKRNPVSVYSSTATPSAWDLTPGAWVPVDFVSPMPYHWNGNSAANQKEGILMALRGCRDGKRTSGGGFLPEFLRSELREIRASLDAYARSARVEGVDKAAACGVALMKTADVAATKGASVSTATNVILVFDESGSMSMHSDNIHRQAEAIRSQLAATMPSATVTVMRFGAMVVAEPRTTASRLSPLRFHANMGGTALYDALATASQMAVNSPDPTLIYLITDGEENQSRQYNSYTCTDAVSSALSTGRVSFGCVGPAQAAGFFRSAGIPSACVRDWYGGGSDLAVVTAEVSKGIAAFADARAAGLSAIEDFFSAPVSGFGDGVRLRVTMGKGSTARRQVVVLDRWD